MTENEYNVVTELQDLVVQQNNLVEEIRQLLDELALIYEKGEKL